MPKVQVVSEQEADLLQKINQGVPLTVQQRYNELNAKLHDEALTPDQHKEFLTIVEQIEHADAERLKHLVELAQIRRISLDALTVLGGIRNAVVRRGTHCPN